MGGRAGRAGAARSLVLPTIFTIAALAVLFALGTWQLQRLAWKEALIAAVEARADAPAVPPPAPPWDDLDLETFDYQHVAATGHFLPGEAHVYSVLSDARGPISGPGYWIVAPFETDAGWIVLVNRGFVPLDRKEPASRPPPPVGEVHLDGVVRGHDTPGTFTPDPDPIANQWFVRDAGVLSRAFDLPAGKPLAPYTVDASVEMMPEGGLPQAGETRRIFPNNHLQYALTWYGLALALAGVYAVFAWGRLRRGRG